MACVCTSEAADVACQYPEQARALVADWTGNLAAGYSAKLQDSPDDATTLFLVGISLLPMTPRKPSGISIAPWPRTPVACSEEFANLTSSGTYYV